MITVTDLALNFGGQDLFKEVDLKFTPGNCYGIIGANGAGKSTFLKILSGEISPTRGDVSITPGERLAVLKQDHFEYDEFQVVETVIMGHKRLYQVMKEKEAIYMKEEFTDEDGIKAAELEGEFAELNGWEAETEAEKILMGLGVDKSYFDKKMANIPAADKVKVLIAQSLFGNPDLLLMDEPTNHLDFRAINWLENFLMDYEKTVIVVSHDRHFLNKICTHMVDIDFKRAKMFVGNYDFWYESSQLMARLMKEQNKKKEDKIKELQSFIARFSSNASKAKQATSRKKLLDKINIEDIMPSTRRYPFVGFFPEREAGKDILTVEGLSKTIEGVKVLDQISFTVNKGDKIVVLSRDEQARTALYEILAGEMEPDEGLCKWGVTTKVGYLPKDNSEFFDGVKMNLIDWLRQFSIEKSEAFIRGFLGKMLFSEQEPLKDASVLSGGEKVRCMFSKLMVSGANVLLLDEPTNHLDLESIQAVNDGLIAFKGTMLFTSHDHKFINTIANRIIEITPSGIYDTMSDFDDYLDNEELQKKIDEMYASK
ncbi:MAG: ATP-binding cassette domain-containing protein [Tissierellales bacterium]|nr:ATP-binding cassette domain-containing protein [Tissierellales bacterium]MBN2826978.1 ATP-binding cassette domain-containing protein [Tissierellales bacterium]